MADDDPDWVQYVRVSNSRFVFSKARGLAEQSWSAPEDQKIDQETWKHQDWSVVGALGHEDTRGPSSGDQQPATGNFMSVS
jgi:hypothetical protein